MGLGPFGGSFSRYDKPSVIVNVQTPNPTPQLVNHKPLPNPDPNNWKLKRQYELGEWLVVEILYPDCTNYEGRKILVYRGVSLGELIDQRTIDPHFSDNKDFHSPIARFVPTVTGWDMAVAMVRTMHNEGAE